MPPGRLENVPPVRQKYKRHLLGCDFTLCMFLVFPDLVFVVCMFGRVQGPRAPPINVPMHRVVSAYTVAQRRARKHIHAVAGVLLKIQAKLEQGCRQPGL